MRRKEAPFEKERAKVLSKGRTRAEWLGADEAEFGGIESRARQKQVHLQDRGCEGNRKFQEV